MAVAQAVGILALPVVRLEELVPGILESVAALQNLLAVGAAALQSRDASVAGIQQVEAEVFHTGAVGVAGTRPGVEVLQEVPGGGVRVVVDAAFVADAGAAVHLLHGHPFDAVEAHVESYPSDFGREILPSPFACPVVVGLAGLPGIRQVLMGVEVRWVRLGLAKHLQLGRWVQRVEREVAGE